jgi:transcription antitermination factor NusG
VGGPDRLIRSYKHPNPTSTNCKREGKTLATSHSSNSGNPRPGDRVEVIEGTFAGWVGDVVTIAEAEILSRGTEGQQPHYMARPDDVWAVLSIFNRKIPVRLASFQVEITQAR